MNAPAIKRIASASAGIVTCDIDRDMRFDTLTLPSADAALLEGIRITVDLSAFEAFNPERDRLQACADQHLADNRTLATHLQECELWPEDSEIVVGIRHMFMATWGLDSDQADARMERFDYLAAIAASTGDQA